MKRIITGAAIALLALGAAACDRGSGDKPMVAASTAGGGAVPNPAMTAPDQTAWNVFIQAVKPSGSSPTTFETWPSDGQTFSPPPQGKLMTAAEVTPAAGLRAPVIPSFRAEARKGAAPAGGGAHGLGAAPAGAAAGAAGGPPNPLPPGLAASGCDGSQNPQTYEPACDPGTMEDVRRNPVTYDYIVKNHLNSQSGLQKAYQSNFVINLPADSVEVKMNWIPVSLLGTYYPGVPQNQFYVATMTVNGAKQPYALIAMHAISKQVPNWTWATFEHQANRGRCDFLGCHDTYGATNPNVAPANNSGDGAANQGTVYPNCGKTAALLSAFKAAGVAAVFQNYCLKGSQADFTDNNGLAIRVGNSVTENGFVPQASCMTCHGEANVTSAGKATSVFGFFPAGSNGNGQIGAINPLLVQYWKLGGPAPGYTPYEGMPGLTRNAISADFVWSIPFCAYDDVTDPKHPKPSRCAAK